MISLNILDVEEAYKFQYQMVIQIMSKAKMVKFSLFQLVHLGRSSNYHFKIH